MEVLLHTVLDRFAHMQMCQANLYLRSVSAFSDNSHSWLSI